MGDQPRDADAWVAEIGVEYDPLLAAALRVLSNRGDHAVALMGGSSSLPYLPWVRDGLSMTSKLIVLLDPLQEDYSPSLQRQMDIDIRIAVHTQDAAGFASDVSQHQVDLLVGAPQHLPLNMLKESGLAVLIGTQEIPDDYFGAPVGESSVAITRPGIQHRLSRRRGTGLPQEARAPGSEGPRKRGP